MLAKDRRPGGDDRVSVVVATRDRPSQLATCVQALRLALRDGDQLVVVDSASRDAVAVRDIADSVGATLLRCELPGVDRARNLGWRSAEHDLLLFTDDDVIVEPTWIAELAAALIRHPETGFVTGRLLARLDEIGPGEPVSPTGVLGRIRARRWSRDVAVKRDPTAEVYDARAVGNLGHGASLAIRRDVLEKLHGWDEALGAGGRFRSAPEADLFDRCFALGLTGRYEPAAVAVHEQWRGPRRVLLLDARYGYGNGARIAKLMRTDRRRARLVAREAVWAWGLADIGRGVRWLDLSRILAAAIRMVSTGAGFLHALPVPVTDGHFASPDRRVD